MSTIWDGLFLQLKNEEMQNEVIIGNLYKPPRNNNNIAKISAFIQEIEPILQDLNSQNSEVFIFGDFNINILKINDEKHFADFLDTMLAYSFYPQITFPTRLNNTSGATLIDNIYYKLSSRLNNTMSGIITDPISNHFPYFMCMNITETKNNKDPRLIKKRINNKLAMDNMLNEMTTTDISQHFDNDITLDPNHTIMWKHSETNICHCDKFHRHRHKNNQWITYGILRSIKYRDQMYITYKKSPQNSAEHHIVKNNLRVFNSILKRVIRETKINYYHEIFEKNKKNITAIWKTISEIICKSSNKRKTLDKIIVDSSTITDAQEICNRFNEFFVGIGPKLANNINTENKDVFNAYITKRILTSFTFTLINQEEVERSISSLKAKTSCGIDGISVILLKFLSPALTKPLAIIINQSLATGIFPTKLKIAKVLPLYKKEDPTLMDSYRPVSLLPSISKVFEKIVFNQLYKYFQDN